ncbi:MAG TPA: (S)-benzoin forming benzil reductase [Bacillota bacterium]|nr:(S)-benzoin forming benzil reductase [Bacillota bacterium]
MKLAIVTGVSRGLGEATAKLFMQEKFRVIGVSRSDYDLTNFAQENNVTYEHISADLSDVATVEQLTGQLEEILTERDVTKLYLVNNAALLGPIDQAMNYNVEDLATHVQVNTIAPMVLTNFLLNICHREDISLTAVTITSGAAERPVYGWSAYCSTKASINMYTKTVGLEQEEIDSGNKVIAFSPGVMDTNMQAEIRSSTEEQFIEVETFREYKETNQLRSPEEVGRVLMNILLNEKIENGQIYYVRDYV